MPQDLDAYWMPFDQDLQSLGEALAEAQLGRLLGAWKIPLLMRRRVQTIRRFFGATS